MNAATKPAMSPLKQRWLLAQAAFEARKKRERWLIVGAAVGALFALGDTLWLSPALKQWKLATAQALQAEKALADLQQAQVLASAQAAQARAQRAAELKQLQAALQALEGRPGALEGARMLALLEELVQRQGGALRLRALSALPDASAPQAVAAAASGAAPARLYRHGIELVLSGPYEALYQYLRELAGSEARLRVRQLSFTVLQHPEVEMTIQVETLSPQAAWLTL